MATRLNAIEAAQQTRQKRLVFEQLAKEQAELLEQRARKDAELNRQLKDAAAKVKRQFQAQMKLLLEAAISGKSSIDLCKRVVCTADLIALGFSIFYVDEAEAQRIRDGLEEKRRESEAAHARKLVQSERIKAIEIVPLQANVDSQISNLLDEIQTEVRFKDLSATKQMAIEHFREKIEDYRNEIVEGKGSKNALFNEIFDGSFLVYKPIERLKLQVEALQISLHRLEQVRCDLPDIYRGDVAYVHRSWSERFELDYDESNVFGGKPKGCEVEREITRDTCSPVMDVDEGPNYYRVEWGGLVSGGAWKFENLYSGASLAWLSGERGQKLLEAIESEIQTAIEDGQMGVQLEISESIGGWNCCIDRFPFEGVPTPKHLVEILKFLKYKTAIESKDAKTIELTIHW